MQANLQQTLRKPQQAHTQHLPAVGGEVGKPIEDDEKMIWHKQL